MRPRVFAAPFALLLVGAACHGAEAWRSFDTPRAFAHAVKLVAFGPRPSGSAEIERSREYIAARLHEAGLRVRRQVFVEQTSRGPVEFVNLIAEPPREWSDDLPWRKPRRIVLASHYDTKWLPEMCFVGANDGGSSTAVLIEIARATVAAKLRPWGCRPEFVFFDGEEATREYSPTDGLHGSRYYVRRAKEDGTLGRIRAMILLDMIGDRDLSAMIPRGDSDLTRRVFAAATALGLREHFRYSPAPMVDDHMPFAMEGVPTADLIDFEYGPANGWWHTTEDTMDKLSPRSFEIIGQTVLKTLETD